PLGLQRCRALLGALVPGGARLGVAVARARVADDERLRHRRKREGECQRDVAAQRESADNRALGPYVLEQRPHVGHGERRGVLLWIRRAVGLAAAAQIPGHHSPAITEGAVLLVPHVTRGAVTVAQQQRGPAAAHLVVDLDAVEPRARHPEPPRRALDRAG